MKAHQTVRQQCERSRPHSKKLDEFLQQKRNQKELEMYEPPNVYEDDLELESYLGRTETTEFSEDVLTNFGTRCALDYYPTTFRPHDKRSDTPTRRENDTSENRRMLSSKELKDSVRSIMQDKHDAYRKDRSASPTRTARLRSIPKYAKFSPRY